MMIPERRSLLKAMALGGLASLATGHAGLVLARDAVATPSGTTVPTLALVSNVAAESPFLRGVAASRAASVVKAQRTGLGLDFILALDQRLRSGQSQRIIGLTDDASATLILDVARSADARVQWLGQHSVTATGARHRLLRSELAASCASEFGQQLSACGGSFSLSEQLPQESVPREIASTAGRHASSGAWAAALGYLLAGMGDTAAGPAPLTGAAAPLTGNFVSFLIEA